jgi:hypothetical protein
MESGRALPQKGGDHASTVGQSRLEMVYDFLEQKVNPLVPETLFGKL